MNQVNGEVQVALVPIFEYRLVPIDGSERETSERQINEMAADGWILGQEVLQGMYCVVMMRQKALRQVPVEQPEILTAQGVMVLRHPGAGGRAGAPSK